MRISATDSMAIQGAMRGSGGQLRQIVSASVRWALAAACEHRGEKVHVAAEIGGRMQVPYASEEPGCRRVWSLKSLFIAKLAAVLKAHSIL